MAKIEVQSEVQGSVWKVLVQVGDAVEEGATLMLVESMKMEIPVVASEGGTVAEILVAPSEPVAEGQVVIVLHA